MRTNWWNTTEEKRSMNCQEIEESFGAYALEALGEDERKAVDAHLAECPYKCRQTLQQLQTIVELFPLSVPSIEPPSRLKEQIIAHIQNNEMAQQYVPQRDIASLRRAKNRQRWSTSLLAASILFLFLLAGGMLIWNLSLHQQVTQLSNRVPPPVTYAIHNTTDSTIVNGQVIYYPQQNITVLIVRGLPRLTGTHVYQGWLLQGNKPQSIGLLNMQGGIASLNFQGNLKGYDVAAVSLEIGPLASHNAPQGPIVAQGLLT